MSRVVLDTDILSEVLAGRDANVAARARAYRESQGHYTFTVIAVVEIVRGLRRAGASARAEAFIASLAHHEVLPLDSEAATLAGEIDASLSARGRPVGLADILVAAIAHRHRLPVVSGNEAHFGYIRDAGYEITIDNWRR
ncbi:MAG: PIN domain-containing protein [Polyangiaceae bacterium]|nr:PIN domain-containing protein [Polyangiaceae bacterium]